LRNASPQLRHEIWSRSARAALPPKSKARFEIPSKSKWRQKASIANADARRRRPSGAHLGAQASCGKRAFDRAKGALYTRRQ
jgi:hypothetical protein